MLMRIFYKLCKGWGAVHSHITHFCSMKMGSHGFCVLYVVHSDGTDLCFVAVKSTHMDQDLAQKYVYK